MRRTTALIAGGGPAGSAAAIALARAGVRPLLLERQRATGDALCGGFLSWRTLETLERLGVAVAGHAIGRVRVFAGEGSGEARLPGLAIGVSRRRLDSALLARAASMGATVERGVTVASATPRAVITGDGAPITADALFLATGKHDCRGLGRPRAEADPTLGLRIRLAPTDRLARLVGDAIELHLFRGGYAGLLLQEDGSANLCLAVRKSRLAAAGGTPRALLDALASSSGPLADRLADAAGPIEAIGAVPYGWRAQGGVPGLFRLGDQAAVIPSLAGEGMGIALASGERAARRFLREGAAGAIGYQHAFSRATGAPLGWAGLVARLAGTDIGRASARWLTPLYPVLARTSRLANAAA